jgi:hypothetical protein
MLPVRSPLPQSIITQLGLGPGLNSWAPLLRHEIIPVAIVADAFGAEAAVGSVAVGEAYIGAAFNAGAVGQNPHVQLFNPATSGNDVWVDWIEWYCNTAGPIAASLRYYDTALATLAGSALSMDRKTGGSSAAELRTASNVGVLGTEVWMQGHQAGELRHFAQPPRPWRLSPGKGMHAVVHPTGANAIFVTFGFRETPAS